MSFKTFIQIIVLTAVLLAAFASPGNAQAQSSCGNTYVVQPGDWLSKIASRAVSLCLKCTQPTRESDTTSTRPGAGHPGGYSGSPGSSYSGSYTVQAGDSFSMIASRYGSA